MGGSWGASWKIAKITMLLLKAKTIRFILRNLKELGFGKKSEESVQVSWFWSQMKFQTVTGGGKSSGGVPGKLQQGGDPGQGPVQHPRSQRHLEDGR